MADTPMQPPNPPDDEGGDPANGPDDGDDQRPLERVQFQQVSARVPEHVARGVFSTGVIVITGATEFVLDFVVRMGRPHQVAARVIMPHSVMPRFIQALRDNIGKYTERFGEPPQLPHFPPPERRPTIQEIYDDLKIPDDVMSGDYANGVMISHTASEFGLDFFTSFFPNSSVSSRVFVSAAQAPKLLESITNTYQQFLQRVQEQQAKRRDPNQPFPPTREGRQRGDADDPDGDIPF